MSEPVLIARDQEHVRLLAIFHYVCAGFAAFFACIPLIYVFLGLFLVLGPIPRGEAPPRFVGVMFMLFGLGFSFLGWVFAALLAWAGRCLSQRSHYTYCFVMACVSCLFQPFGTVLGIFTIIVLLRPTVKAMFSEREPARL